MTNFSQPSPIVEAGGIEEVHYVVRNSSTQALFGFCSTYYYTSLGLGMLGALFVDPAKRNLSIGHSLHQRAVLCLSQKQEITQLQLGSGMPGIYLGIPMSDLTDGAPIKRWFATNGWDVSSPRLLYTLTIRNLQDYVQPEGLLKEIQRVSYAFDLIHGPDNAATVLEHVQTHASPEVLELYRLAFDDQKCCGIVRAKSPVDGALVGTVIISRKGTQLANYLPILHAGGESVGGILAPVVPNSPQASIVLQGLAMLGIRQNKAHGHTATVLNWVQGEERDTLLGMGFDVLDAFEELSCKPKFVSSLIFGTSICHVLIIDSSMQRLA